MEYLEHRIAREDAERERKYLEEIGSFGQLFDNPLYYVITLFIMSMLGMLIGLFIGFFVI
jgi:pheromone shutdown protein TraB